MKGGEGETMDQPSENLEEALARAFYVDKSLNLFKMRSYLFHFILFRFFLFLFYFLFGQVSCCGLFVLLRSFSSSSVAWISFFVCPLDVLVVAVVVAATLFMVHSLICIQMCVLLSAPKATLMDESRC